MLVCDWDPYNAVIISEIAGKVEFQHIEEGCILIELNLMSKQASRESNY